MRPAPSSFLFFFVVAGSFLPALTSAYQEIPVHEGGTVTGVVRLEGPVPSARMFRVGNSPFGDFCKKISDGQGNIALEEYTVSPTGGFQDAIVSILQITAGKPFTPVSMKFNAMDCMFHPAHVAHHEMYEKDSKGNVQHIHPLVTVFQDRQILSVQNHDPIFHNSQVFQRDTGHILLNFPLPAHRSFERRLHFERKGNIVQIVCGMHEYMQAFGIVADNPYYALTKRDGRFTIDQVPPGKYTLMVWHPHFKPITREIEILPHGKVTESFVFQAKEIQRRIFETAEGFRNSLN